MIRYDPTLRTGAECESCGGKWAILSTNIDDETGPVVVMAAHDCDSIGVLATWTLKDDGTWRIWTTDTEHGFLATEEPETPISPTPPLVPDPPKLEIQNCWTCEFDAHNDSCDNETPETDAWARLHCTDMMPAKDAPACPGWAAKVPYDDKEEPEPETAQPQICARCGADFGFCSICRTRYPHGSTAVCLKPECAEKHAVIDCDCGYVVEADLRGVLSPALELITWEAP